MAIDTAQKRGSSIQIALPLRISLPFPDSTIDAGDRAFTSFAYAGITGAPVTATDTQITGFHANTGSMMRRG